MGDSPYRILLDSNVWRYLVDEDLVQKLVKIQNQSKNRLRIYVSPVSVYEAYELEDSALRRRLMKALANPNWKRFMTESFTQSEQLFQQISEHHPEWLTGSNNLPTYRRLKYDWSRKTGGFWTRTFNNDQSERDINLNLTDSAALPLRIASGKKLRQSGISNTISTKYDDVSAIPPIGKNGQNQMVIFDSKGDWPSEVVNHPFCSQHWRVWGLLGFSPPWAVGGFGDWLHERIHIENACTSNSAYVDFWFKEVDPKSMSAHWLGGFFDLFTRARKESTGTLWDIALGSYLDQCDLFVSADKIFCDLVNKCNLEAPFKTASALKIQGGAQGMEKLFQSLSEM